VGHADEFLKLFKKNHYPVLRKKWRWTDRESSGWISPRYHTTEDGRWIIRVTIVFKNASVANEAFAKQGCKSRCIPTRRRFNGKSSAGSRILDATGICR